MTSLLHPLKRLLALGLLIGGVAACSNIDCPLDNVVLMQCNFYSSETQSPLKLADSLSVRLAANGLTVVNTSTGVEKFLAPLKDSGECDTLLLHFSNTQGQLATDTLVVEHRPQPHFESLDCPPSFFHTLTAVRATSHPLAEMPLTVDSVSLIRPIVNYDDIENIRIYLRAISGR